jgi:branched-chain amino acid transport system permease protein
MAAYLAHYLVMVGIYTILALSLNLLIGYSGIFSLAHAALYGIGAYASALVALKLGLGFWGCAWRAITTSSPRSVCRR